MDLGAGILLPNHLIETLLSTLNDMFEAIDSDRTEVS